MSNIGKLFHVSKFTVYHLAQQQRKTGSVELRTSHCGRKALLSSGDKERICRRIEEKPDITLAELRTELGLKASIQTLSRVIRAMGYRVKKMSLSATEKERHMTRRYGRGVGGKRIHGAVPLNTPKSRTILASMRLNGQTTYTMYAGGTTGERFLDYLKNVLIPTLHRGDIVIMDNMRSHHVDGVKETLCEAGMVPLYLPP